MRQYLRSILETSALSFSMSAENSLFDRIGGETVVEGLIDTFYDRVLNDEVLKPFFEHTPMDKLRRMQREFFAAALDGPIKYSGKPLAYVHQGRGIKPSHIGHFVGHLIDSLKDANLDADDVSEIIDHINKYADELTGGGSVDG